MSQPVPNIGADDVSHLLAREFGESAETARTILGALSGTHPGAVARVSAAVINLARGDLDELRAGVAAALTDWRDVIAWAEYPHYMALPRDAAPAARAAAIEADWANYRAWLER